MMISLPPPPPGYAGRMPIVPEAGVLVAVGPDCQGRDAWLSPEAAVAWRAMCEAARADHIDLLLVSAFRSVARQAELVAAKLARGMTLDAVLVYSAYPGFSEHHSGHAIDIGCDGCPHLEEEFESTAAFDWLVRHAGNFGFEMSFPRGNDRGVAYEPWHWCYHPAMI